MGRLCTILHDLHDGKNHNGYNTVCCDFFSMYFLDGASELIRKYCQQCQSCQMDNRNSAVPVPQVCSSVFFIKPIS